MRCCCESVRLSLGSAVPSLINTKRFSIEFDGFGGLISLGLVLLI